MTLEDVESRLNNDYNAIVVRLSSTIPGFITVSCNASDTGQPIHVRFQVRSDLSIRGEKDISYNSFHTFIHSLRSDQEQHELQMPQNTPEGSCVPSKVAVPANNIGNIEPQSHVVNNKLAPPNNKGAGQDQGAGQYLDIDEPIMLDKEKSKEEFVNNYAPENSHVALYARTADISTWVKEAEGVENGNRMPPKSNLNGGQDEVEGQGGDITSTLLDGPFSDVKQSNSENKIIEKESNLENISNNPENNKKKGNR
eukprot:UN31079